MSEELKSRIHLIYAVGVAVLVAILGVCFAVSCVTIYQSGDRPFTYESIGAQFEAIKIPVFICLGAILGGFALSIFMPRYKKPPAEAPSLSVKLSRLRLRREITDEARREARLRHTMQIIGTAIWALCAVPIVIYMLSGDNFYLDAQNPNPSVIAFMKLFLPCVTVALGVGVLLVSLVKASVLREIALLEASAKKGDGDDDDIPEKKTNPKALRIVRICVFALAAVFIVVGAWNGGLADVLAKAIAICTECIGLG